MKLFLFSSNKAASSGSSTKRAQSLKSKQKRSIEHSHSSEIPRLKYPKSTYTFSESSLAENSNHKSLLNTLIDELCVSEENNIKKYFSSLTTTSSSNIQPSQRKMAAIEESLVSLLQELPSSLRDACPESVFFLPELSLEEREHIRELTHTRELLAQQSSILTGYAEDLKAFSEAFGLTNHVNSTTNGNAHGGNISSSNSSSQLSVVDRVTVALSNLCEQDPIDIDTASSSSDSGNGFNNHKKCTLEAIENEVSAVRSLPPLAYYPCSN